MIDLLEMKLRLAQLEQERQELGLPKAIGDRIRSLDFVLDVVDRERQKRGAHA